MLQSEALDGVPILLLANKQDLNVSMCQAKNTKQPLSGPTKRMGTAVHIHPYFL